jgi:hypothetical protein
MHYKFISYRDYTQTCIKIKERSFCIVIPDARTTVCTSGKYEREMRQMN